MSSLSREVLALSSLEVSQCPILDETRSSLVQGFGTA